MVKSILTVIDATKICKSTADYSYTMVKKFNSKLTGLAVLDVEWITASQAEPLGGAAYKLYRDEQSLAHSHEKVDNAINEFKQNAILCGVSATSLEIEGVPLSVMEYTAFSHDLVIVGQDMNFHFQIEESSDDVLLDLVKDSPRPIIFIPKDFEINVSGKNTKKEDITLNDNIVIAYDGSICASRALHMFLMSGIADNGSQCHIVTINKDRDQAMHLLSPAVDLCKLYGLKVKEHCIEEKNNIVDQILNFTNDISANILVIGANHQDSLTDVVFGNFSQKIIHDSEIPVFVYN